MVGVEESCAISNLSSPTSPNHLPQRPYISLNELVLLLLGMGEDGEEVFLVCMQTTLPVATVTTSSKHDN